MKRWVWPLISLLQSWAPLTAFAYDVQTHADISSKAAAVSGLALGDVLTRIGLRSLSLDDPRQAFEGLPVGRPRSIEELFRFGATWEDDRSVLQALRHFYDPVNDLALNLTETVGTAMSTKSPDWALEDVAASPPLAEQMFSYKDARDYFYRALAAPSEMERKNNWGLMFQALGHVIHHLQDMAQPQHVRNDPHCDHWGCATSAFVLQSKQLYSPSLYEHYTNDKEVRPKLLFDGPDSTAVYPGRDPATNPFTTPRRFWRTTSPGYDIAPGKGIAEYTSRNFFSAGTIGRYLAPSTPDPTSPFAEKVDISELLPGSGLHGMLYFYSTIVSDALTGTSSVNKRSIASGLFSPDLTKISSTQVPNAFFSLNRFTFDAAHQYLIPRAVAYSAGLINYFFRGQMEISLPEEGVYSAIDHNDPANADPLTGGFPKIKLKLRNMTSRGVTQSGNPIIEPMIEGSSATLVAVAKFHRNNCYQQDLSGEYGSPGNDWHSCRSAREEVAVSNPVAVPAGINASPQPVTFIFPNRIPISATDLYLQVVYRGPLGEEPDAVVVETKDISEPTYGYNYQNWDAFTYSCPSWPVLSTGGVYGTNGGGGGACSGNYTYAQWCTGSSGAFPTVDDCKRAMGLTVKYQFSPTSQPIANYDPANNPAVPPGTWTDLAQEMPFTPLLTMPGVVGTFSRVAILTDANPTNALLFVQEHIDDTHHAANFQWSSGSFVATINQADPATNTLTPSMTYRQARGVYVPAANYDWTMGYGQVPNPATLTPVMSSVNF